MKKVILIDDRQERKKLHLSDESLSELLRLVKNGQLTISTEIDDEHSLEAVLKDYDLIAVHRSYLANTSMLNSINEYMKCSNKYFIIFSGGISQNIILNKGHQLNINSADFYVSKLPDFIELFCTEIDLQSPLLHFLYDKSWKLTLLLQLRHLLWTYGDLDESIDDPIDANSAEELLDILYDGESNISIEDINIEIEKEKERRINS